MSIWKKNTWHVAGQSTTKPKNSGRTPFQLSSAALRSGGIDRKKLVIVNMDADIGRIYLSVISRDGRNYFHEADRQFYTDAGKLLNFPSFYGFFVQAARGRLRG